MRDLKVLFLAAGSREDFTLSGRFRVFNYLKFLSANGVRTRVIVWNSPLKTLTENIDRIRSPRWLRPDTPGKLLKLAALLSLAPCYDIVVVQRTRLPARVLALLRRAARHLVFDFDDALFEACPYLGVPEWSGENVEAIRERFLRMLPSYDHIIAGNEHLAEFVRAHGVDSTVIPTPVDTGAFRPRMLHPDGDFPVIGWVGAGEQHLPHLRLLVKPLVRLRRHHRFVFRIIGVMGSPAFRQLFEPELAGTVEYVDAVAPDKLETALKEFSVGVMPLVDDPWSRGKCGYKALLTMACAIPTVASPVGVNKDIIRHQENGLLAGTEDEWYDALSYVLSNPERMHALGAQGRRAVEERFSQDVCERQLLEVLRLVAMGSDRKSTAGRDGREGARAR